jgi:DNA-binding response OmpR family regulator
MRNCTLILGERLAEQHAIAAILVKDGWSVQVYTTAYDILSLREFVPLPDLFIVDLHLTGINGLELCRWLKQGQQTADVPVVLLAASPDLKVLALDTPADRVVNLPFTTDRLLDAVRDILPVNFDRWSEKIGQYPKPEQDQKIRHDEIAVPGD